MVLWCSALHDDGQDHARDAEIRNTYHPSPLIGCCNSASPHIDPTLRNLSHSIPHPCRPASHGRNSSPALQHTMDNPSWYTTRAKHELDAKHVHHDASLVRPLLAAMASFRFPFCTKRWFLKNFWSIPFRDGYRFVFGRLIPFRCALKD